MGGPLVEKKEIMQVVEHVEMTITTMETTIHVHLTSSHETLENVKKTALDLLDECLERWDKHKA